MSQSALVKRYAAGSVIASIKLDAADTVGDCTHPSCPANAAPNGIRADGASADSYAELRPAALRLFAGIK